MLFLKHMFYNNCLFSSAEIDVQEPKTLEYFLFALCQIVFFSLIRTIFKIDLKFVS
jgi:hypothetical protein